MFITAIDPPDHAFLLFIAGPFGNAVASNGAAMDLYHVWCDLKPGVSDLKFAESASRYLEHLKSQGLIQGWRLTRRKLGLGVAALGDFHLIIETSDLSQLEQAFQHVASRREPVESFHFALNSLVQNTVFGLYRDFPDAVRHSGEEKF
jgi:hypothetical protein